MERKTRLALSIIILVLLILTVTTFVDAKKGGKRGLPCSGPILTTSQAPGGKVCYSQCGSPAECHYMIPGGKGPGCDFGQICDDTCNCVWADKDLDGYTNTSDCNDYNAYVHPQAIELCDNIDNDCDDIIDEDDVCEKNIYICKTDSFIIENKGDGKNLSYGHCTEGEWCSNKIIGESGSCTYTTTERDGLGQKDFYSYVCDMYTCYKFTKGSFMVCGEGWNCTEVCVPEECNYATKEWCNDLGIWQTEDWCQSECGQSDSTCEGTCEDGRCDVNERKYCQDGEWIDPGENYCAPGYCGTKDPSCECSNDEDDCCKGEDDWICDTDCLEGADKDCKDCTVATGDCCDDSSGDGCDADCIPGVDPDCKTDCGTGSDDCCSDLDDGNCDPDCTENSDINCVGVCTTIGGDCCVPDSNGYCDPDCIPSVDPDCAAHPCEENWVCNEWDVDCDGINGDHTCLEWEDKNKCNTFFEKPEDALPCYIDFPCTKNDDTDGDGYPERACYDTVNDKVLEELDCDDNDAAQNLEAGEICNGEDDNCDDSIDEGCPCKEGDTQQCGKDEGICKQGIQLCTEGLWSICGGSGYVGPSKEACDDGLDNNCDGYIDENCKCVEGQKQECGSSVGICKQGWQACYNSSFGSVCNDEVKSVTEICNNNLDDDCDSTLDGDDSNCQVTTPTTTGAEHCKNRIQDAGETGLDCGDSKDCPDCSDKSPACDYGKIEEKCTCGPAEYKTGYCCNGKYSLVACVERSKDSDDDGCNDDKELQMGTDVRNGDTDGDGLLDCDPKEKFPLCNEDGNCDAEKEYPETLENCPADCGTKGIGWLTWLILILIILGLVGVVGYLYAKSKGYKMSDFIKKVFGKKKEEKPKFQFGMQRGTTMTQATPEVVKPERKRDIVKLREFTNNALKKGYTKLQVRQSVLKAGWSEQEIDIVLKGKKSGYKLFK